MESEIHCLQGVLNEFVGAYQKNPIKYFYEEDIRAELLFKLQSKEAFDITLPISENNEWLRDQVPFLGKERKISGIKAEYPSNTRFDIAYVNPDNDSNHYNYGCLFAIEIKLSQKDNKNRDFKLDIEKLQAYRREHQDFLGIAIDFEQNPLVGRENLDRDYRNLNMRELTQGIELSSNSISYFFINQNFKLGGHLD